MKKIITSSLMLILSSLVLYAQEVFKFSIVDGPKMLPQEACQLPASGISDNGAYIWGTYSNISFIYNRPTGKTVIEGDGERQMVQVKQVLGDGTTLLFSNYNGMLREADGKEIALHSPVDDNPMVNPKQITNDKKIIVGNLENAAFDQIPFYATRQQDDSYQMHLLASPKEDALGAKPQFIQAFFCSQDGKFIIGRLINSVGGGSLIVWKQQTDGSYLYELPLEHLFFNLNKEKPGPLPEWDDYVTAEEGTKEYEEQADAFDKAYDEWMEKKQAFVKNEQLNLVWFLSDAAEPTVYSEVANDKNETYPILYNYVTGEYRPFKEAKGRIITNHLRDDSYLTVSENDWSFKAEVMKDNGKTIVAFEDWIKEKTGSDVSGFYQGNVGFTFLSADGKTIVSQRRNLDSEGDLYHNAIIVADRSLLSGATAIDTVPEHETLSFRYDGQLVIAPAGSLLHIYDMQGTLVRSAIVPDAGHSNLAVCLPKGTYIIQGEHHGSKHQIKIIK